MYEHSIKTCFYRFRNRVIIYHWKDYMEARRKERSRRYGCRLGGIHIMDNEGGVR